MGKRKPQIKQPEIVGLFGARLRELRASRGMTQAELGRQAHVATSYLWRLESGSAAPGIDLAERLAKALGTTVHDLLPTTDPPDTKSVLQSQARKLFETLMETASREDLLMLCPLLARLVESPTRRR